MSEIHEIEYFKYMKETIQNLKATEIREAIQTVGTMIDEAIELKNQIGLQMAIDTAESLLTNVENIEELTLSVLYYYIGVAYSELGVVNYELRDECLEKNILNYRLSLALMESSNIHISNTLVNLSNSMSAVGRVFDSLRYIDEALKYNKQHPIALGNKARMLEMVAKGLYDEGHIRLIYASIYKLYQEALNQTDLPEYAKSVYEPAYEHLKKNSTYFETLTNENHKEVLSIEQGKHRDYRLWCLNNQLFLNPLNSVMKNDRSARDIFGLPSIVAAIGDGPYFHSMFNNIKQEFVSARYFFFKGLSRESTHFSDKDVAIYNTMDYASQSYNNECVKSGFRVAYSLLDKMAYFINIYYGFGMPYHKVKFNSIWSEKVKSTKDQFQTRPELRLEKNWAINALYWLSKELHEKDMFSRELSSFSRKVPVLRNHIEHKHLKILDMDFGSRGFVEPEGYAMSIERDDFIETTMFLFKIVRDAIMYLSIAISIEEDLRKAENEDQLTAPMFIKHIDDEWKR